MQTWRKTWLAVGLVAFAAGGAFGQALVLDLDGSLEGRAGERKITATLGQGAELVQSVEGQGLEQTGPGPAVTIPVPDDLWRPEGTLAFRIRASRTLRYAKGKKPLTASLVNCPLFRLSLAEDKRHLVLRASVASAGKRTREVRRATQGQLFWSHLEGGAWYHFAFTWHAAKGRMDTYLNGSIQQEMRLGGRWHAWKPPAQPSGPLELGGALGPGEAMARMAVDQVRLYPTFMDEAQVAALLKGRPNFALAGEGRWDIPGSLDLKPYRLTLVHEADFAKPLNWMHEDKLFDGKRRTARPDGKEWVLEGKGKAWTEAGRLVVQSTGEKRPSHLVLWNTRPFPESFLLEFGISPMNSRIGLTIVFFASRSVKGGSPFDLDVPKRSGVFRNYHSGALNGYHVSYWACNPRDGGILRRTTNLRKNAGFFMPACGIDRVAGMGPGPHRVRLLKAGNKIRLETRGRLALVFDDDGATYGSVWKDGWIGLRQMGHTRRVAYTHFKVWKVDAR